MTITKACTKCNHEKPLNQFYLNKVNGNVFTACMDCTRASNRARYLSKVKVLKYPRITYQEEINERKESFFLSDGPA